MRDAVVVAAVRTAVGTRKGQLSGLHPAEMSAIVLQALIDQAGVEADKIDDVLWGCVNQVGEQASNIARNAVLAAGWPHTVPGSTIERQCGSSQQALSFAAACVMAGQCDLVVAGGVESMSRIPLGSGAGALPGQSPLSPSYVRRYGDARPNQGVSAQLIAERWALNRSALDAYSLRSHERAAKAADSGAFDKQIVAIPTAEGVVTQDQGIRRGSSLEKLAALKPAFRPTDDITAGNSSQISDGAAAVLVTTSEYAARAGLTPLVRIHTSVVTGSDPVLMLTGPIPATAKALSRSNVDLREFGVFEVNEAFASVVLAWLAETGADDAIVNPVGGAIALGHPLGASGARLTTSIVHHMRSNGIRYGLQTMCEGGGQANATVFELLA